MVFALGVPSSSNITDGKLSPSLFKLKDISFPLFHKRWFCSCWLAAASVVTISAGKLFFQFLHVLHTFYLVRKKKLLLYSCRAKKAKHTHDKQERKREKSWQDRDKRVVLHTFFQFDNFLGWGSVFLCSKYEIPSLFLSWITPKGWPIL